MKQTDFRKKIEPYIKHNELEKVYAYLQEYVGGQNADLSNQIILLTAQYHRNKKGLEDNKINRENYGVGETILAERVLSLIDNLPDYSEADMYIPAFQPPKYEKAKISFPPFPQC